MTLTLDNPAVGAITCACGNPIASHACPTVYAPRSVKTAADNCPACGFKRHANMDAATVRFECQWRQWSHATSQLTVRTGKTIRYLMPPFTVANVAAFALWVQGSPFRADELQADPIRVATLDAQKPETTSAAKRAQARAASAPPQPTVPTPVVPTQDDDDDGPWEDITADPVAMAGFADALDAEVAKLDAAADDAMIAMDDAMPDVTIGALVAATDDDDADSWEF